MSAPAPEVDACGAILVRRVRRHEKHGLLIVVDEALADPEPVPTRLGLAHGIAPRAASRSFALAWSGCVTHAVTSETYAILPAGAVPVAGRLVVLYGRSPFLDHVRRTTWASDAHPGRLRHVAVRGLDLVVDVAATDLPEVEPVEPPPDPEDGPGRLH